MNFAELRFWEQLAAAGLVVWVLRQVVGRLRPTAGSLFDKIALLGIGFFLLASASGLTFVIFLGIALFTYAGLSLIQAAPAPKRTAYMGALIALQLTPLLYFKYSGFLRTLWGSQASGSLTALAIPIGISFYTFQKIAFVLDTMALRSARPAFLDYLNFTAFFPQIVAGPIERKNLLLPQLENFRFRWQTDELNAGASWIALGFFFKCCLAENFATYFSPAAPLNAYLIWLNNLLFGLRIYYDFAGYSLIALGMARCLGIRLTLNFASPYCSASIAEFWRRWHITLSQWFRDYLYVPLGGGRTKWWWATIILVFVTSGCWHGAGWNFLAWGAFHALCLIAQRTLNGGVLSAPLGWILTQLAVFFSWLFFYETNTAQLLLKLRTVLMPSAYSRASLLEAVQIFTGPKWLVVATLGVFAAVSLTLEWLSIRQPGEPYRHLRRPGVLAILIILTVWLAPGTSNGFIYFAF